MGRGMKAGKKPKQSGGKNNMQAQMQQMAQMQEAMDEMQAKIDEMEVTASAGGGAVTVKVNGKKELQEVILEPEIVDPDDIEMLQDLIISAVNEATRQMDEISSAEMEKLTGSLGLPPGIL